MTKVKDIASESQPSISTASPTLADDPDIGRETRRAARSDGARAWRCRGSNGPGRASSFNPLVGLPPPDVRSALYSTVTKRFETEAFISPRRLRKEDRINACPGCTEFRQAPAQCRRRFWGARHSRETPPYGYRLNR